LRLLSDAVTDATEALALSHALRHRHDIISAAWGPTDDPALGPDGPGPLTAAAIAAAASSGGSAGRGAVLVFAAGNGGPRGDDCNLDGYANSPLAVAVGAVAHDGIAPHYAERCAAMLAVAYSGGRGVGIGTTEPGAACIETHTGTSAAAALASGIIALALSARNELGPRDVQDLIVTSAIPTDPTGGEWQLNGAGLPVSHRYGFGRLDARRLVAAALRRRRRLPVFPQRLRLRASIGAPDAATRPAADQTEAVTSHPLPFAPDVLFADILVDQDTADSAGLRRLTHVQLQIDLHHPSPHLLHIALVSPSGTRSVLASPRPPLPHPPPPANSAATHTRSDALPDRPVETYDRIDVADGDAGATDSHDALPPSHAYPNWTFTTVQAWGERPAGVWRLELADPRRGAVDPFTGASRRHAHLVAWTLLLLGHCRDFDVDGHGSGGGGDDVGSRPAPLEDDDCSMAPAGAGGHEVAVRTTLSLSSSSADASSVRPSPLSSAFSSHQRPGLSPPPSLGPAAAAFFFAAAAAAVAAFLAVRRCWRRRSRRQPDLRAIPPRQRLVPRPADDASLTARQQRVAPATHAPAATAAAVLRRTKSCSLLDD
ncbi:pheromone processing endoprotease, partial [Cladochytrium tenue]